MINQGLENRMCDAVRFGVGPAFEINYALSVLTDDQARIHSSWKRSVWQQLPGSFEAAYQRIGAHPIIWMMVPDVYPIMPADASFEEAIAAIESVSQDFILRESLVGLLHYPDHVNTLISGAATLSEVVVAIPKEKREWLMYVGLYPYDPSSPAVRVVERLLADPGGFRADVLALLKSFWQRVFRETWRVLRPQMQRSADESERLFAASTFAELAATLRLRIEVNEAGGYFQAIRGGDRLAVNNLESCWISPSAFNDKRFWYSREHAGGRITAYFPYFDPSISLGLDNRYASGSHSVIEPELDPALIFKALGNTTRYAIATLLAQRPRPAGDLAEALSLSKPTISHHVHLLREAGLLNEAPRGGSVVLTLRPETLERLSSMTLAAFFDNDTIENARKYNS